MINRMVLCFAVLGVVCGFVSAAPQKESLNDAVIAAAYVQTIAAAIEKGNWSTALTQAERGKEFSNVDSDLSYLLALTRYQQRQAKGSALRALDDGVRLAQWHIFSFEEAKLLEATILISLKEYSAALAALAMVRKSNLEARARLLALRGLGQTDLFLAVLSEALEQYPSDTGLVRILAETATGLQDKTTELMARVLWRLPVLSESDPELSFLLCPFIQDTATNDTSSSGILS
ncbi:tetratricopeptide repeat protein [Breznakiellaceae bacterium SP9]